MARPRVPNGRFWLYFDDGTRGLGLEKTLSFGVTLQGKQNGLRYE